MSRLCPESLLAFISWVASPVVEGIAPLVVGLSGKSVLFATPHTHFPFPRNAPRTFRVDASYIADVLEPVGHDPRILAEECGDTIMLDTFDYPESPTADAFDALMAWPFVEAIEPDTEPPVWEDSLSVPTALRPGEWFERVWPDAYDADGTMRDASETPMVTVYGQSATDIAILDAERWSNKWSDAPWLERAWNRAESFGDVVIGSDIMDHAERVNDDTDAEPHTQARDAADIWYGSHPDDDGGFPGEDMLAERLDDMRWEAHLAAMYYD